MKLSNACRVMIVDLNYRVGARVNVERSNREYQALRTLQKHGYVNIIGNYYYLTDKGQKYFVTCILKSWQTLIR